MPLDLIEETAEQRAAYVAATKPMRNAPASESGSGEWPKPLSIPSALLPVEPFDLELLPASIRGWVTDIAERMQCPPDFPAVGAMVALSSVIGRKACIAPKRRDDWRVVPNLWGAVVGRPGVMKSPALSEIMKPLDRLALLASDLHKEAMRDFEINSKIEGMGGKEAEKKAQVLVGKGKTEEARHLLTQAADAEGDTPPALRRYKVTDASVEALGEILIENPWGTLAYRDELNGLLRSLDKEGQEGARAFYLQGYDGNQGYTFDRIMRGRNLHIPAVCIAMLGGIQPGKLQAYIRDAVSGGAGDDGLLQRFGLLVWPDVGGGWRNVDRFPDTPAKKAAFEVFQKLDAMLPGTDPETNEPAPVVYRFSPDAQDEFDAWRQTFETGLRTGDLHPAMESHLSKYRKLVPALALVCALTDGETNVGRDSLLWALAWSEYLQSHAARAYGAGTGLDTEGATALLIKINAGKVADGFKPADVYWKGWANLGTPEGVHAAARMLCDLGHLRQAEVRPAGAGRPSTIYRINPATLAGVRS
jgi:putative DNA primase/helicase